MSFLSELRPGELTDVDWDTLRLAAHFPTQDQVRALSERLGLPARGPDWFQARVESLFEKFTDDEHLGRLLDYARGLGFDQALVGEALTGLNGPVPEAATADRAGAAYSLSPSKRSAVLGALYWAYRDEIRRRTAAQDVDWADYASFAASLYLPVQILDAALVHGWRHSGADGCDIDAAVLGARDWMNPELALMDEVWSNLVGADDSPTLFGVASYQPIRVEKIGRSALHLRLHETNYRAFKGTNDVFQASGGAFAHRAWKLGLGRAEMRDPANLAESRLANPLSVTCVAYLYDRPGSKRLLMGVQNRNFQRVHSGRYCYQATAGGFVTVAGDTLRDDRPYRDAPPDPFLTIAREFGEEAFRLPGELPDGARSSAITPEDVTLLALVRDLASCWEVGLVGEIVLPFTKKDIDDGRYRRGSDYYFEGEQRAGRDPIEWVEATPAGLAQWLAAPERHGRIGEFMPFGLAAIVLSFYHRGFSPREIHESLEPVAGQGGRHLLMTATRRRGDAPPRPDLLQRQLGCWSRT